MKSVLRQKGSINRHVRTVSWFCSPLGGTSMRTRRLLALALGLAVVLAFGQIVSAGKTPGGRDEPKAEGKPALGKGKRAQEFIAAFEKGDAKAVAAFWTENADYVDQTGREFKGRAAIQKMYEKLFAGKKGMKLNIIITSTRTVGTDVALEDGITEITTADSALPSAARFSAVLVKKGGDWF